jgi:hypothetical protein
MIHKTGIRILEATVGIKANARSLLPCFPLKIEVPSLLTDFRGITEIPDSEKLDGHIVLENIPADWTEYSLSGSTAGFRGPLIMLEKKASDIRYSLWGNQGFLYRFILYLLEARHNIFSFHAVGLYDKKNHRLFVVAGGAGSGKTVYLLSGIAKGLKLFSTETVHFRFEKKGLRWFKGSLVDNIRVRTLIHHFPQFCPPEIAGTGGDSAWRKKIALDLSAYQCDADTLLLPRVILLFPHVEEARKGFVCDRMANAQTGAKAVFDNLAQKIAETVVLYDHVPVPGFDNSGLAKARLNASYKLVRHASLETTASVISNPHECWGNLLNA